MMRSREVRTLLAGAAALLLGAACAKQREGGPQLAPLPNRPLAGLAGQHVVVLPAHYVRPADSLGWSAELTAPREYLGKLDDEIAFALRERGFRTGWAFPEDLARTARRNAGFTANPYALAAEALRPLGRQRAPQLGEPLATQLRAIVALHDARYALFPVEIRFEKLPGGTGRAVLHVVLVDARLSQVTWGADVASDPAPALTPALAASVASKLADLIAAP